MKKTIAKIILIICAAGIIAILAYQTADYLWRCYQSSKPAYTFRVEKE